MGETNIGPQLSNNNNLHYNYSNYASEKLDSTEEVEENNNIVLSVPYQSKTLEELYPDQINLSFDKIEGKNTNLSLLERLRNFWNSFGKSQAVAIAKKEVEGTDAISFAPVLEKPANLIENIKLPKLKEPSSSLSDEQVFEGLSQLSEESLYQIMLSVLIIQNESCQKNMLMAMEDFERFHQAQILDQKVLKEIKQTLVKDEKVRNFFKTTQNIALAVGTVATLAMFTGIVIPFALGAAAVGGAVSIGAKGYFGVRADENSAKFIGATHTAQVRQKWMEDTNQNISSLSQMGTEKQIAEFLGSMIKRILKIIKSQ